MHNSTFKKDQYIHASKIKVSTHKEFSIVLKEKVSKQFKENIIAYHVSSSLNVTNLHILVVFFQDGIAKHNFVCKLINV